MKEITDSLHFAAVGTFLFYFAETDSYNEMIFIFNIWNIKAQKIAVFLSKFIWNKVSLYQINLSLNHSMGRKLSQIWWKNASNTEFDSSHNVPKYMLFRKQITSFDSYLICRLQMLSKSGLWFLCLVKTKEPINFNIKFKNRQLHQQR